MGQAAPFPPNETERLAVLNRLNILDSEPDSVFDDIVSLTAELFDVPICLVSLVDTDRQWFKARIGLDAQTTPRDVGFCAYAILHNDVFVVEDATLDRRFADSPLVTGYPHVRFYAGAPLTIEAGINVGSLCIIDREPRRVRDGELDKLRVLARAVAAHMRLNRLEQEWPGIGTRVALCAWCRNVRTETDGVASWKPLHEYVAAIETVSHGICPSCASEMSGGKSPA